MAQILIRSKSGEVLYQGAHTSLKEAIEVSTKEGINLSNADLTDFFTELRTGETPKSSLIEQVASVPMPKPVEAPPQPSVPEQPKMDEPPAAFEDPMVEFDVVPPKPPVYTDSNKVPEVEEGDVIKRGPRRVIDMQDDAPSQSEGEKQAKFPKAKEANRERAASEPAIEDVIKEVGGGGRAAASGGPAEPAGAAGAPSADMSEDELEAFANAKYFVRGRKRDIPGSKVSIWELSPVEHPEDDAELESFEVYVEQGGRVEKDLVACEGKVAKMVFSGEPNVNEPVKLLGVIKTRRQTIGYEAELLKEMGYPGFDNLTNAPGEISIQPLPDDLADAIDANGHLKTAQDQVAVMMDIAKDPKKLEAVRKRARGQVTNGLQTELARLDVNRDYYRNQAKEVILRGSIPEGWNEKTIAFAKYALPDDKGNTEARAIFERAIPEINKFAKNYESPEKAAEFEIAVKGALKKQLGENNYDIDAISKSLIGLSGAERADLCMLVREKDGESSVIEAQKAFELRGALNGVLGKDGDIENKTGSYAISSSLRLANKVKEAVLDDDTIQDKTKAFKSYQNTLETLKTQLNDMEYSEAGNLIVADSVRAKMDATFGSAEQGYWDTNTLHWIRNMSPAVYNRAMSLDVMAQEELVDATQQLQFADNARNHVEYAAILWENKSIDVPNDMGGFLGKDGKVFNVNYNSFVTHPDDEKKLTTKPVMTHGDDVAKELVGFYSQQALYDEITMKTSMSFAQNQIDLAHEGAIPAPNPEEYDEVEIPNKLGRKMRGFKPKPEQVSKSWEIAQMTAAQVMSQVALATYGKTAPGQHVHEGLQKSIEPFATPNNLNSNMEAVGYILKQDAGKYDKNSPIGKPRNQRTHLQQLADATYGKRDLKRWKPIDPKWKMGAALFGLLASGLVVNSVEELDQSFG